MRVKVLDVDIPRKRISLTLRLEDDAGRGGSPRGNPSRGEQPRKTTQPRGTQPRGTAQPRAAQPRPRRREPSAPTGALADALRRAGLVDEFGNSVANNVTAPKRTGRGR